ncbi:MAG TPA: lytic transglycosylase domain-containing protein [Candidatus Gallimonas intestinavium]|uniref:Lytic transglycosylase domain-containing protein n=1 Tax=Candidatus Gallimonas intestinavium TaxID=2838603 RepID=A0A9D2G539_9FIRM|nr:lytic transglycosylase domain-containing protein [Candidatus Gallimonas intestinavium]
MKRLLALAALSLLILSLFLCCFAAFPRPYRGIVERSGLSPALAYAVMKAESNFEESAVSSAGAVGLMQLLPSTAQFIAERSGIPFLPERLFDGEYNTRLGCAYLAYLLERFEEETALAAYNAGEGTVQGWLSDPHCSEDGRTLFQIPYAETRRYLKKISFFRKIYGFFPD